MNKGRLEAFSDRMIAIFITIVVLEFKVPHASAPTGLLPLLLAFFSYALSFVFLGIYWSNHHHRRWSSMWRVPDRRIEKTLTG